MPAILHVDMDAFFAAVELQRHPELAQRPVIIGGSGDPQARGVVSTASYPARRFGVHSGMPLRTAHRLCPQAVFLPVDFRAYARVSRIIKRILRRFSRKLEDAGLDEAYLDVSGAAADPVELALTIKRAVVDETGLTCSVGVGPNKLLAKLASDMDKPDGLTVLSLADVPTRVWPLPVRALPGVGPKTEARLARLGVTTIGQLAALAQEQLVQTFGEAHGRYLYTAARGLDDTPVVTRWQRHSVGEETTFQTDISDPDRLREVVADLSRAAVARLRQYHYRARTITVKVRSATFQTRSRSLTLPHATDDLATVQDAARQCLAHLAPDRPVRLLGVRLERLDTRRRQRASDGVEA